MSCIWWYNCRQQACSSWINFPLENRDRFDLCLVFSKHFHIWAGFFSNLLLFKKSILLFTLTLATTTFHFFLKQIYLCCLPYARFQNRGSTIPKHWCVDSCTSGTIYHAAKGGKLLTFNKAAGRLQQIPP